MDKPRLLYVNAAILLLSPIAALIIVPLYGFTVGYDAFEWSVFAAFMMATGLSITAGYHRLWAHRAYEAHPAVRLFFAVLCPAELYPALVGRSPQASPLRR